MEIITSVKNPIILQTRKRKKEPVDSLFLENIKLIKEAVNSGHKIQYLLILNSKYDEIIANNDFVIENKYYLVSQNVLDSICDTVSPQGIVAVIEFKIQDLREPKGNFLVLENLQDAGNLGTIIRSARGTSFNDIYLINCVDFRNQKVIRSTMGGIFKCNLFHLNTTEEFLGFKNKFSLKFLTATMEGQNLFTMDKLDYPIGIVIGNEGKGVSEELKNNSYKQVSIPMKNDLESLNAGVSCSIIMYYLDNLEK